MCLILDNNNVTAQRGLNEEGLILGKISFHSNLRNKGKIYKNSVL